MTQNLAPGATVAPVGTDQAQINAGAVYTATSGSITTATSTVTTGNIGRAGNLTVFIFGTYAGVNVTFEASPDNTNWFAWPMQREQTSTIEFASGVLASNSLVAWTTDCPGFSFFRVRATAWSSGTASVVINPGTLAFMPVVSNVSRIDVGRNAISLQQQGGSSQATDTLASLTGYKSGAAVTATTTPAVVTTGKTLRVQSITLGYGATATAGSVRVTMRANTGGAVAIGSPIVSQWSVGSSSATATTWGVVEVPIPDGLEFAAGTGIGFSVLGLNASMVGTAVGFYSITLLGYEY